MSAKPLSKKRKQQEKDVQLSTTFSPRFWSDADGRIALVKKIRRKADEYKEDCGADNAMMDTLCERAAFLRVRIDTYEIEYAEGKAIPDGVYTQMVNCLSGLLSKLGLETKERAPESLSTILAESRRSK